jgi:multidrug resistance efflux pump
MIREVSGPGTFVPEEVHFITAMQPARVERVVVKPGATVGPDTLLVVLTNPDLELAALEADRQLAQSEAELTNLRASLEAQRLAQESAIASIRSEAGEARRRAEADEALAKKGFLSELERGQTRDKATELAGRLSFEQKRLASQSQGMSAQTAAQRAQVERLRSIADFRHKEVERLAVRAGSAGVLEELALWPGQSVTAGTVLAKIARPDRLKAEVRVPEILAKDVQIGQRAAIDTHNGVAAGTVSRIDPSVQNGTVKVDVSFDGALPAGARPDLSIEGTIELERLADVLSVARPAFGQPHQTITLFRLDPTGQEATRTRVQLGAGSVKSIEIRGGLAEGDRVIVSDMSQWDRVDRIRLH